MHMTINKAIEQVDGIVLNTFDTEAKFHWIANLDGMIARVVMGMAEPVSYEYPKDMDKPLLVWEPFEDIYELYLQAMIDFHNREYDNYNNSMLMFNERLEDYKAWYIREYGYGGAKNFRNVFG